MLLSIIIPVHNEENTLVEIVHKILDLKLPESVTKEIIILDDFSTDGSGEIIKNLGEEYRAIRVFQNEVNLGKSLTVKRGINESLGDYIIVQDADLEYCPDDIVRMVELMMEEKLDVVYGNRFGKRSKVIYLRNYIGNRIVSLVSNVFTFLRIKTWIPDMEVCYKLIRGSIARKIANDLKSKSTFGFEPEITAKLSRFERKGKHLKFGILPVSYYPRTIEEGKHMRAFKDGFKAILEIFRFNLFN